jgi:deoxyribonuclease V
MTTKSAAKKQAALASKVVEAPMPRNVRYVAGVDVAVAPDRETLIAGVVIYDRRSRKIVERVSARKTVLFPYVPGFLSFREAPPVLSAFRELNQVPDAILFDAQGIAHPRRLGLASHVGIFLDIPSVGCAKSRLIGEHGAVGQTKGNTADLIDRGEVIGKVVRTRDGVKPVFVSVGHRVQLDEAVALVLDCCRGVRLPQPTHVAHQFVTSLRRE